MIIGETLLVMIDLGDDLGDESFIHHWLNSIGDDWWVKQYWWWLTMMSDEHCLTIISDHCCSDHRLASHSSQPLLVSIIIQQVAGLWQLLIIIDTQWMILVDCIVQAASHLTITNCHLRPLSIRDGETNDNWSHLPATKVIGNIVWLFLVHSLWFLGHIRRYLLRFLCLSLAPPFLSPWHIHEVLLLRFKRSIPGNERCQGKERSRNVSWTTVKNNVWE